MRNIFLVLVLIAIALILGMLYHSRELERQESVRQKEKESAAATAAAAPKQNFGQIIALLQGDLVKVCAPLSAPQQTPANAYRLKERIGSLQNIQEYQVVDRVCSLLIYADQERGVRLQDYQMAVSKTGAGALDTGPVDVRVRAERDAIKDRTEKSWNEYTAKTRAEVQRLLGTLQGREL